MTIEAPPHILGYTPGSFAHFTITKRLPKILSDCDFNSQLRASKTGEWACFVNSLQHGSTIPTAHFSTPTPYWHQFIANIEGQSWKDISFFNIEFLFYHWINSRLEYWSTGVDAFVGTRITAASDDIRQFSTSLAAIEDSTANSRLASLIALATDGNVADLSQISTPAFIQSSAPTRLLDDSDSLINILINSTSRKLDYIADNCGFELMADLALINEIINRYQISVTLHLKPCPMFVSDANIQDVYHTIELFDKFSSATAALSSELNAALANGRLCLEDSDEWGEPRFIVDLSESLKTQLEKACVVIVKGDLNYRRVVEDRLWAPDEPTGSLQRPLEVPIVALRVMKSDTVLGLPAEVVAQLDMSDSAWRFNGTKSLVQRL
jgi:hypothetical protein